MDSFRTCVSMHATECAPGREGGSGDEILNNRIDDHSSKEKLHVEKQQEDPLNAPSLAGVGEKASIGGHRVPPSHPLPREYQTLFVCERQGTDLKKGRRR